MRAASSQARKLALAQRVAQDSFLIRSEVILR
jgi:hypothetical protein